MESYDLKRIGITENRWSLLFAEAGGVCPLCGGPLIGHKEGRLVKLAEEAHIYPHSITAEQRQALSGVDKPVDVESLDNLIPLCFNCHVYQDTATTREDYERLKAAKARIKAQYERLNKLSEVKLEEDILLAVEKLRKLSARGIKATLVMKPNKVAKKVRNPLLMERIRQNVTRYFRYLQGLFSAGEEFTTGEYDLIATDFRKAYLTARNAGGNEESIFEALIHWVDSKTSCGSTAAEILVSYFVQDCEVFDAIS